MELIPIQPQTATHRPGAGLANRAKNDAGGIPFLSALQQAAGGKPKEANAASSLNPVLRRLMTELKQLLGHPIMDGASPPEKIKDLAEVLQEITEMLQNNKEPANIMADLHINLQAFMSAVREFQSLPGSGTGQHPRKDTALGRLHKIAGQILRQLSAAHVTERGHPQMQTGGMMHALPEGKPAEWLHHGSKIYSQRTAQPKRQGVPLATSTHMKDTALSAFKRIVQQGDTNRQPVFSAGIDSGPMHKLQQFILHVRQGGGAAQEQQFVRDFQHILAKSTFTGDSGRQVLTIRLHPRHLGTLNVQLIQHNGQMTATLLTSTVAAKHLVESHLHQLQGAFASQNLHVDKLQVMLPYGDLTAERERDDGGFQEGSRDQQHGDREGTDEDRNEEESSFSDWIEELHLMKFGGEADDQSR
ncbi:MAG TPA: flagellar hook-length control protein FliK [Bacillales bacterium]|nr:flagellar hook-length control protein FliK [Bacillales bacterium]